LSSPGSSTRTCVRTRIVCERATPGSIHLNSAVMASQTPQALGIDRGFGRERTTWARLVSRGGAA
jgi:hypothetical protein